MGTVTRAPFTLNFKGTTGLFGAENQFIEIPVKVTDFFPDIPVVNGDYIDPTITNIADNEQFFQPGNIDPLSDNVDVNQFQFGIVTNDILQTGKALFSVVINNKGTGNMYEDRWLDVQLYTKEREEHPYDLMWLRPVDKFYVGFHARNTRRLNFDVDVTIGRAYTSEYALTPAERRFLPNLIRG